MSVSEADFSQQRRKPLDHSRRLIAGSLLLAAVPAHAAVNASLSTVAFVAPGAVALAQSHSVNAKETAKPEQGSLNGVQVAQADTVDGTQVAQADNAAIGEAVVQEVLVLGRKTVEPLAQLKDVPASVSVIDGDDLPALGADSLRDVTRRAANISRANTSNARNQALVVRGIGRRGSTEAQDPTVGINIDGIPYAYPGLAAWDFVDVETVKIARGPQGTEGGHNPSFGLLSLTTKRPTWEPESDFSLRVGQRDSLFGSAAFGGPIIDDKLAWRGTFYVNKALGAYGNTYWNDNQTYTDRLKISGKVQFLAKVTDSYTVHVSADLQPKSFENDNGLNFFHATPATYSNGQATNMATDPKTRLARRWFGQLENYNYENNYLNYQTGQQNNDAQLPLITGTRGLGLTQTFNLNDTTTLTSITGYRDLDFEARNDEGTPFDISTQGGGGVRYQQFTQELKLQGLLAEQHEYTVGAFYINAKYEVDSKTGWGDDAGAWFANAAQYTGLDADGDGRYLLTQSLSGLRKLSTAYIDNTSPAVFANVKWHFGDASLVTGLRATRENRKNNTFSLIEDNGYGGLLNPVTSTFGVPLGGFDATTLNDPTSPYYATATAAANAAAQKYFRAASYGVLTAGQKAQLAQAQAIRKSQLGQIFNTIYAEKFEKTQLNYVLSPSYRFSSEYTGYFSYQHGEKPGISQVVNGNSLLADGESGNHYELGVKTDLFNHKLQVNADVFLSKLKNYQQSSSVVDTFTTNFNNDGTLYYTTVAANVPRIQVHGFELDGSLSAIPYTTLTLAAAYNIARYKSFPSAPATPENQWPAANGNPAAPAFQDLTGRILPGAAKYTANLGANFEYPVWTDYNFHTNVNYNYTSRYNGDITLSSYSWIKDYSIVDLAIGIGTQSGSFDVNLLAKNLLDEEGKAENWQNGTLDTTPRWIGVVFTGHFR